MDARLIIDPPARGAWNMAVDEALFRTAQHSREVSLRFYEWSEPTLTLGYFQPSGERQSHPASRNCPCVRRSTGGGAIVHDRELTYSFIAPIGDDRSNESQKYVGKVHAALIAALESLGVRSFPYGVNEPLSRDAEPFLCFHRRSADDVIMGEYKIAGSAQRRLHGTLLQHGSVLLARSLAAPELPGIAEVLPGDVPIDKLREAWILQLAKTLQYRLKMTNRSGDEDELASRVEQAKFAASQWNQRR